jgi:hypothetical protein
MAPSIGLNLRVTGYKHQGGRKYMEDEFGVAYQQTADEKDLEYAFFGIFDGHGGREAALFAKVSFGKILIRWLVSVISPSFSLQNYTVPPSSSSGTVLQCSGSVMFVTDPDPRIRTSGFRIRIVITGTSTFLLFNIDHCC